MTETGYSYKALEYKYKLLFLLTLLIPLWWLIGVKAFIFHVTILIVFIMQLLKLKAKNRTSKVNIVLILFILTYLSSIIINFNNHDVSRIIGSLYNLSYWIIGFCLIFTIENSSYKVRSWIMLFNAFRFVGLLQGLLGLIIIISFRGVNNPISFETPILKVLPDALKTDIIEDSSRISIIRVDWFLEELFPRISGFFLYPTALGIGMVVIIFMSLVVYHHKKTSVFRRFIEITIMLIPFFYALSRTAFLAIVISFLIVELIVSFKDKKDRFKLKIVYASSLAILLILLFTNLNFFQYFNEYLLDSREGSNNLRSIVYTIAINTVIENNILLGVGAKFHVEGINISIGSHSTFIGAFLKSGLIGFIILVLFNFLVMCKWMSNLKKVLNRKELIIWKYTGMAFISLVIWQFTEDIDAPQIVSFMYFLLIAHILSFKNSNSNV